MPRCSQSKAWPGRAAAPPFPPAAWLDWPPLTPPPPPPIAFSLGRRLSSQRGRLQLPSAVSSQRPVDPGARCSAAATPVRPPHSQPSPCFHFFSFFPSDPLPGLNLPSPSSSKAENLQLPPECPAFTLSTSEGAQAAPSAPFLHPFLLPPLSSPLRPSLLRR